MSKLLKLKSWLSLEDAAKHLTAVLEEEVEVKDVLGLALDGHLKLSVYFVNEVRVNCGKSVSIDRARKFDLFALIQGDKKNIILSPESDSPHLLGEPLNKREVLELAGVEAEIRGVWDLPLHKGVRLIIENERLNLMDGPKVKLTDPTGVIVEHQCGDLLQLLTPCEGWENYSPEPYFKVAYCLPDDALLVVKTEALSDLLAALSTEPSPQKQPKTRERPEPYRLIAQLIKMVLPDADLQKAYQTHETLTSKLIGEERLEVSPATLEKYLEKI